MNKHHTPDRQVGAITSQFSSMDEFLTFHNRLTSEFLFNKIGCACELLFEDLHSNSWIAEKLGLASGDAVSMMRTRYARRNEAYKKAQQEEKKV